MSRSGESNLRPSAYQPSALPPGQAGSHAPQCLNNSRCNPTPTPPAFSHPAPPPLRLRPARKWDRLRRGSEKGGKVLWHTLTAPRGWKGPIQCSTDGQRDGHVQCSFNNIDHNVFYRSLLSEKARPSMDEWQKVSHNSIYRRRGKKTSLSVSECHENVFNHLSLRFFVNYRFAKKTSAQWHSDQAEDREDVIMIWWKWMEWMLNQYKEASKISP